MTEVPPEQRLWNLILRVADALAAGPQNVRRERTSAEWQALLEAAGFGIDQIDDGLIQASCR